MGGKGKKTTGESLNRPNPGLALSGELVKRCVGWDIRPSPSASISRNTSPGNGAPACSRLNASTDCGRSKNESNWLCGHRKPVTDRRSVRGEVGEGG